MIEREDPEVLFLLLNFKTRNLGFIFSVISKLGHRQLVFLSCRAIGPVLRRMQKIIGTKSNIGINH